MLVGDMVHLLLAMATGQEADLGVSVLALLRVPLLVQTLSKSFRRLRKSGIAQVSHATGCGTGSLLLIQTDPATFQLRSSVCGFLTLCKTYFCRLICCWWLLEKALINGDWSPFDLDTVKLLMSIFVCSTRPTNCTWLTLL